MWIGNTDFINVSAMTFGKSVPLLVKETCPNLLIEVYPAGVVN